MGIQDFIKLSSEERKNLQKLHISDLKVTPSFNRSLRELSSQGFTYKEIANLSEADFSLFLMAITECNNLQELVLEYNNFDRWNEESLKLVRTIILQNKETLQKIILASNAFHCYPEKLISFCKVISQYKNLKHLNLESTGVSQWNEATSKQVCQTILNCNLQELAFGCNKFNSINLPLFCQAIAHSKLRKLSLKGMDLFSLKSDELKLLLNSINQCKTLQELDLEGNSFGSFPPLVTLLCNFIATSKLQKLNLGTNDLELNSECLTLLLNSINQCETLEELDLKGNKFGDSEPCVQLLCDFIATSRLQKLNLKATVLKDCFNLVYNAIAQNKNLFLVLVEFNIAGMEKAINDLTRLNRALSYLPGNRGGKQEPPSLLFLASKYVASKYVASNFDKLDIKIFKSLPLEVRNPIENYQTAFSEVFLLEQLFIDIEEQNFEQFKTLINGNPQFNINKKNTMGHTLLHVASSNLKTGIAPNTDFLKKLLEAGADPTIVDKNGWTPVHHAAYQGNREHIAVYQVIPEVNWKAKTNKQETIVDLIKEGRNKFPKGHHSDVKRYVERNIPLESEVQKTSIKFK